MRGVVSGLALLVVLVAGTAAVAQEKAKAGDVVWAEWKPNAWYHGRIARVDGNDFHIVFDDGDKAVVDASRIVPDRAPRKDAVKVHTRVLARFKQTGFFPGKITRIEGDRYEVKFDDGDVDRVALDGLRLIGDDPDITGKYDCEGTNPQGNTYRGTVEITRKGDAYDVKWTLNAGDSYGGVGILEGDVLGVSINGGGIVVYRVKRDGKLVGRWSSANGKGKVYTETLTNRGNRKEEP